MKTISIYVITHKKYQMPNDKTYVPLLVGSNHADIEGYLKDNTGDNISEKNENYCELTGLYWIWKNGNKDIEGIVHYRRYFGKLIGKNNLYDSILSAKDIIKYLSSYDIIVPYKVPVKSGENVYSEFAFYHSIKDLDLCAQTIQELYPEYLSSVKLVFKRNYLYPYNMFITRKEILNRYCAWLFDLLEHVEGKMNLEQYDTYQARVYGFLGERLFNIWLEMHKEYRIKECAVYRDDQILYKERLYCVLFKKLLGPRVEAKYIAKIEK